LGLKWRQGYPIMTMRNTKALCLKGFAINGLR
jgi:hypothetical protein